MKKKKHATAIADEDDCSLIPPSDIQIFHFQPTIPITHNNCLCNHFFFLSNWSSIETKNKRKITITIKIKIKNNGGFGWDECGIVEEHAIKYSEIGRWDRAL